MLVINMVGLTGKRWKHFTKEGEYWNSFYWDWVLPKGYRINRREGGMVCLVRMV